MKTRKPLTPERRELLRERQREYRRNRTPEQRERQRELNRLRWSNMTPEERQRRREQRPPRTPEERQRRAEMARATWLAMSPEQRKLRRGSYTPEQRERYRERARACYRQRQYGLDPESLAQLLADQGWKCPCGQQLCAYRKDESPGVMVAHVDHDHTTGEVRACLCGPCNRAVGLLHDSPLRAFIVFMYLWLFNGELEGMEPMLPLERHNVGEIVEIFRRMLEPRIVYVKEAAK